MPRANWSFERMKQRILSPSRISQASGSSGWEAASGSMIIKHMQQLETTSLASLVCCPSTICAKSLSLSHTPHTFGQAVQCRTSGLPPRSAIDRIEEEIPSTGARSLSKRGWINPLPAPDPTGDHLRLFSLRLVASISETCWCLS